MPKSDAHRARAASASWRQGVEFVVCLLVAICFVRTWAAESYVVPSASMAGTVVGLHRDVVCGDCGLTFACGTDELAADASHLAPSRLQAACPNCGYYENDLAEWPDASGDRLLVNKSAFALARPRRWQVAVFRSPEIARRVFIKRVVGLPGESIEIRDGDVYVDGQIARKNLDEQRAVAMTVHDSRHEPTRHSQLPPRWRGETEATGWSGRDGEFRYTPRPSTSDSLEWLAYHHVRRVPGDSRRVEPAAVSDDCGYNQTRPRRVENVNHVRDLMLRCRVSTTGEGRLALFATDGRDSFVATLRPASGEIELAHNGRQVASSSTGGPLLQSTATVELSLVDRQFALAIDGLAVLEPYAYESSDVPLQPSTRPLAIGSDGLSIEASDLVVLRDVYYTRPFGARWAVDSPCRLGPDEYFVLGDNSEVSDDSRLWTRGPGVPSEMLVGQPVVVHLPSRHVRLGGFDLQVPDLGRIRAIH